MAEADGNQYVTRAVLRAELLAVEDRVINRVTKAIGNAIARSQVEILEKTQAFIRDRQTELLRAFERATVFEDVEG